MKTYILFIVSKETKPILKFIEELLDNKEEDYSCNTLVFGGFRIITFKSKKSILEIKEKILKYSTPSPLFFLVDTIDNDKFTMNFENLESKIKLENVKIEELNDNNLTLNDLLDLVLKNGFPSLTEKQKIRLKELSEL